MKFLPLALASFLLATAASFAAVDLGSPAGYTPYDRYMSPVKKVLGTLQGQSTDMKRVQELLRVGRGFRYSFTDPYTAALPSVTAQTHAGDCKAKSLWLVDQLGDANVRYVIGRARATSKISHAWVMWNDGRSWWILDPTNTARPIAAEAVSRREYIPLYSWAKNGSYRHASTALNFAAVAGKTKSRHAAVAATGERR
jgi:hypothetical protein